MQIQQEQTQAASNRKQLVRKVIPLTALLAVAGIAFGVMSQSAQAAAPSALAATKVPKPTRTPKVAVAPTAVVTEAMMMHPEEYLAGAEGVYSDTARVVKSLVQQKDNFQMATG